MKTDIKKLVFVALMVSASLVLHLVESSLPLLYFVVPGLKLGLSNIISLILLYTMSAYYAIVVLCIRMVLSSFFGGGISAFMFSITGGLLSIFVMKLSKEQKLLPISIPVVSVLGAISFNLGQLIVASFMVRNFYVLSYLPIMGIVSIGTGLFIGYSSKFIVERVDIKKMFR